MVRRVGTGVLYLLLGALAIVMSACSGGSEVSDRFHPDGGVRTDPSAVALLVPELGTPASIHWTSGRLGDDRVPGPSGFYLHAVVEVTPDVTSSLVPTSSTPTDLTQVLDPALADLVPPGDAVGVISASVGSPSGPARSIYRIGSTSTLLVLLGADSPIISPSGG